MTTDRACLACSRPLPAHDGPGRPPSYCSRGCRRVAERELTRLDGALEMAENRLRVLRGLLAGVGVEHGKTAADLRHEHEWWETERRRLVERQAAMLQAAPETPTQPEEVAKPC